MVKVGSKGLECVGERVDLLNVMGEKRLEFNFGEGNSGFWGGFVRFMVILEQILERE